MVSVPGSYSSLRGLFLHVIYLHNIRLIPQAYCFSMAASHGQTSIASQPNVGELSIDAARFEISEIELEVTNDDVLGDTQDAREDHGIADISIGRTSLDGVFNEIHYGLYKGRPACRILMTLTVKADSDFRLSKADLTCTVASDSTSQLSVTSSDIVRPSILKVAPPALNDSNPTAVGITASLSLSPSVSIPNGPEINLGSFTKQRVYTQSYGWHLHSTAKSSNPQHRTSRDTGIWSFTANRMQKDSDMHSFGIELLVRHGGLPFYADFELSATLVFGAMIRTIGRKKKIRTRRNFAPCESAMIFS